MHPAYFEVRFRHAGDDIVWPLSFSIITAYAMTGEHWSEEKNRSADMRLQRELREMQMWMCRVSGYSPSSGHTEPGWAVEMPFEMACDTGRCYNQDAIYFIEGDQLFVSFCDERRKQIVVDGFRTRLDRPMGSDLE